MSKLFDEDNDPLVVIGGDTNDEYDSEAADLILKHVESQILDRGYEYYHDGNIQEITRVHSEEHGMEVFAKITGSGKKKYSCGIFIDDKDYECSCPSYKQPCKHLAAVAIALKQKPVEPHSKDKLVSGYDHFQGAELVFEYNYQFMTFQPVLIEGDKKAHVKKALHLTYAVNCDEQLVKKLEKQGLFLNRGRSATGIKTEDLLSIYGSLPEKTRESLRLTRGNRTLNVDVTDDYDIIPLKLNTILLRIAEEHESVEPLTAEQRNQLGDVLTEKYDDDIILPVPVYYKDGLYWPLLFTDQCLYLRDQLINASSVKMSQKSNYYGYYTHFSKRLLKKKPLPGVFGLERVDSLHQGAFSYIDLFRFAFFVFTAVINEQCNEKYSSFRQITAQFDTYTEPVDILVLNQFYEYTNLHLLYKPLRMIDYVNIQQKNEKILQKKTTSLDKDLQQIQENALTLGPVPAVSLWVDENYKSLRLQGKVEMAYAGTTEELADIRAGNIEKEDMALFSIAELHNFIVQRKQTVYHPADEKTVIRNISEEYDLLQKIPHALSLNRENGTFKVANSKIVNFLDKTLKKLRKLNPVFFIQKEILPVVERPTVLNFEIHESSQVDWFNIKVDFPGVPVSEIAAIVRQAMKKSSDDFYRTKSGTYIRIDSEKLRETLKAMHLYKISPDAEGAVKNVSLNQISAIEMMHVFNTRVTAHNKRLKERLKAFNRKPVEMPAMPGSFHGSLRAYQHQGTEFLYNLYHYNAGGILADDMGLGKTIQALAFLNLLFEKDSTSLFLIVGPLAALRVWQKEAARFVPQIPVQVWHGPERQNAQLSKKGIVVTTYGTLRSDIEMLSQHKFQVMVADEAQNLKNSKARISIEIRKIEVETIFLLTGTPVENRLADLHSLFDLFFPGLLGSQERFKDVYGLGLTANDSEALKRIISPFILRRTKQQVLKSLPSKTETSVLLPMTAKQQKKYEEARQQALNEIYNLAEKPFTVILKNITILRRIAGHPEVKKAEKARAEDSNKTLYIKENIEEFLDSAKGILIFSQFTDMLKAVQAVLDKMKIHHYYLDGSTPAKKRHEIEDKFQDEQNPTKIFLISLKAGGTALTLTRADTVIHLDPWWNPAAEDQASDRAHRIGQKNKVFIYRLISQDSIEERVQDLQKKKRDLVNSLLDESTREYEKLDNETLMKLLEH